MDSTTSHADGIKKVNELIAGTRFAMFTTLCSDGSLHSRPMTTLEHDFDGDLWFFTGKDTTAVEDVRFKSQVNVAYANPKRNDWVSVSGEARLVDDLDKKKELWNDAFKAWFDGVEDPNLVLLCVKASGAEYWDGAGKLTTLLGMARAAVTGKKPADLGESGKVDL